ncbi:MAG: helix-turn-helix transcriptional regulator [Bacteroidetes bacterium]|nr:helix-turn-helix transcriptional regulator [Bacteroidota bacterium]
MNTQIQNNLKIIRINKRLTQKQVAEHLQMQCENRLSHWEKGTAFPSISNLGKLCQLFQVPAHEIYPELQVQ